MSDNNSKSGVGATTVLLIVFVVLKMTDNVEWSWFWVLSPFWIPCGLVLSLLAVWAPFWIARVVSEKRRATKRMAKQYDDLSARPGGDR
ncbi:hypothetical protein LCGC14_2592250 [marine sediment metagenome]|uniref:Uncharacterized protein n=1 Tax=marine sediment metagenome TaxID=412755 RepID=A0A0F9ABK2_9ZZZZ